MQGHGILNTGFVGLRWVLYVAQAGPQTLNAAEDDLLPILLPIWDQVRLCNQFGVLWV